MGHDHLKNNRTQSKSRLLAVLTLISTFTVVEVIVAFFSRSLALWADAGHMLTDVGAILLALLAIWFAAKPATPEKTYGYYRSEILAGLINALILVGVAILILIEAYQRFQNPIQINPLPIFCVAFLGLIVNVVSLKLLGDTHGESINTRAAYLEILGDSMISAGVMLSSIIIYFTHWYVADSVISGIIGLVILPRTWILLRECVNILMEGTPAHINLEALRKAILSVEGVSAVHDIHVWTITSGLDSMSGHVLIDPSLKTEAVLTAITEILHEEFHLHHTTIQIEKAACKNGIDACAS